MLLCAPAFYLLQHINCFFLLLYLPPLPRAQHQISIVRSDLQQPKDIEEQVVPPSAHTVYPTVSLPQLFLPLQQFVNYDQRNPFHSDIRRVLLKIYLQLQLHQVYVLIVEEVHQQLPQMLPHKLDVCQVAFSGDVSSWLFILEVNKALEINQKLVRPHFAVLQS